MLCFIFFQAEDGIRDDLVTGVQTCALPMTDICPPEARPNDAFGLFTPTRYSSTDSTPSGMTEMSAPSPPTILSVTSIPSNVKVFWSSLAPATRIPTLGKEPVPGVTPGC